MVFPLLAALLAVQAQPTPPPVGVTVGSSIPAITLPTVDSRQAVNLGDRQGKPLLLLQFASW